MGGKTINGSPKPHFSEMIEGKPCGLTLPMEPGLSWIVFQYNKRDAWISCVS